MTDVAEDLETEEVETEEEPEEVEIPKSDANLKFETKKFVFQALLDKASSILPSRDIMPVLKNFQVEITEDSMKVVATDLELSIVTETGMVNVTTPGTAVFPGRRLLDLVKEADDSDMIVDVVDGTAHITVGRTTWDLQLMDGSEYPPLPDVDDVEFETVDRSVLLNGINSVRGAAATDTIRPALMMIDVDGGKMRAADGVRFQQIDLEDQLTISMQIPIGAVDDLVRVLRSTDVNTLQVGETENHLVFSIASDVFIANKTVELFPDIDGILLKPALLNDQKFSVDRADLMQAIKRVRVTADPMTSAIMLNLSKNKVNVSSKDMFGNQAHEEIDAFWDNEDRTIAVNHEFIMQMLDMSDAKSSEFWLGKDTSTRKSPVLLRDDSSKTLGVISQLRIEWVG